MGGPRLNKNELHLFVIALIFLSSSFGCVRRQSEKSLSLRAERTTSTLSQTNQTKANDQQPGLSNTVRSSQPTKRININTGSAQVLEQLPGIGRALADRIIEHREQYGPFRRAEHLIIVRGISDRKFRALRDLITVE